MLKFDEKGLIPAIAQDADTKEVLMLAYMNPESLKRTQDSGQAWFYSRSRQEIWHKGATSGSYLNVRSIIADCDGDALLLQVQPTGPVCHTGNRTCFFQPLPGGKAEETPPAETGPEILSELFQVIQERQEKPPPGSYVARLLGEGLDRVGKKVIEEAGEAVIAAKNGQREATIREVADLWFHSLLLLAASGLVPDDVWQELRARRK